MSFQTRESDGGTENFETIQEAFAWYRASLGQPSQFAYEFDEHDNQPWTELKNEVEKISWDRKRFIVVHDLKELLEWSEPSLKQIRELRPGFLETKIKEPIWIHQTLYEFIDDGLPKILEVLTESEFIKTYVDPPVKKRKNGRTRRREKLRREKA